jgi:bacillithiol biosynthesis cysteine-adding enzyme BshC
VTVSLTDLTVISEGSGEFPAIIPTDAAWNRALDAAIAPCRERDALLARLHAPGALVVTTGQQPGLFTGPLYTVHKALAAAALARRLEAVWGRPVIALFWLAGDDHDYREASSAAWLDAQGRPDGWTLAARPDHVPQLPMSHTPLPSEVAQALEHFRKTTPPGPHAEATFAWLERHYRAGATMHGAYRDALAELLGPYGVACLDATHPVMKSAQRPLLRNALRDAAALDATLAALPDAGTGIATGDGATLVFVETEVGRDRLVLEEDGFRTRRGRQAFSMETLEHLLETSPERFSANVLLRPVIERALLPTVAYVAGPGEYRYLTAQASALYPAFGLTPQQPVRRWSGTVLEPWVQRVLDRLQLSVTEVLIADTRDVARRVLRRDMPAVLMEAVAELRRAVAASEAPLAQAGAVLDPVLDRAVAGRMRKLVAVVDDMEHLFERHLRKRDDIAHAQLRRVLDALRPGGGPQERRLTAATFLSRYGTAWMDAIAAATDEWASGYPA